MTDRTGDPGEDELDVFARIIHLGFMTFGVLAWLTSELAEDYEHAKHLGFTVHSWLGMGLGVAILFRLIYGLFGPANVRFALWVPYTRDRLVLVWEDLRNLLRLRLPDRPIHVGLSGLVQTFGLLVFLWMALTGSLMFFSLTPGRQAGALLHFIKEVHGIGEAAIPLFLGLHVGAVILHALFGNHLWRKVFFLAERR